MFRRVSTRRRRIILLLTVLIMIYGLWHLSTIALNLDVTRHDVYLEGLPPSQDGVVVAQISDLHHGPFTKAAFIKKVVEKVNESKPDYIMVTGDFVSVSPSYADKCMEILAKLKPKEHVYMVAGNHDYPDNIYEIRKAATKYNLNLMFNTSVQLADNFYLAGIDDESEGDANHQKALNGVPDTAATIIITHEPSTARHVQDRNALVLTGHTHGGQIGIPYVTRKFMARNFGYRSGWYNIGKVQLYVNRGIGFNGLIPIRFRCDPEISLFTLHPKK